MGQETAFLWEAVVKDVSLHFPTSRGHLHSFVCCSLHLQRWLHSIFQSLSLTMILLPLSFPYKDLCDYIWPTQITQDFFYSNSLILILSIKFLLAYQLTYSQILEIRTQTSFRGHYSFSYITKLFYLLSLVLRSRFTDFVFLFSCTVSVSDWESFIFWIELFSSA